MIVLISLIILYTFINPCLCTNDSLRWPLYHELYSEIQKSSAFYSDHYPNLSDVGNCGRLHSQIDFINAFPDNYSLGIENPAESNCTSASSGKVFEYILHHSDFLPVISSRSLSIDCLADLYYLVESLRKRVEWALKVVDSFGKIPPGLSTGNVIWPGNYDQCLEVQAPSSNITFHVGPIRYKHDASFSAQYCLLQIISMNNPPPPVPGGYLLEGLTIGICMSRRCTESMLSSVASEVDKIFNKTLAPLGLQISGVKCPRKKDYLDSTGILAVLILTTMSLLVIIGTFYEVCVVGLGSSSESKGILDDTAVTLSDQQDDVTADDKALISPSPPGTVARILTSFSLITNGRRLFSLSTKSYSTPDALPSTPIFEFGCLHGLRFLSMAWIILGHTYYFSFAVSSNPLDRLDPDKRDFWYQAIIQATYSCDTFFVISAFLVATQFFQIADQYPLVIGTWRFWITFYLQRFVRIAPPYLLILCTYIGLWKYVGNGPFWPTEGFEDDDCRRTWWSNLLFINNYINLKADPSDGTGSKREYCAGWTWYLANDMQFYWISPLVLYPIFKRRQNRRFSWFGYIALAVLFIAGLAVTGIIARVNELPPNMFPADLSLRDKAQLMKDELYFKPYPHIPCYVIGLILALVLRRRRQQQQEQEEPVRGRKIWVFIGWSLSFSFAMAIIYGLWPQYRGHPFSPDLSACYVATSRAVFAACVAWVAYACITGHGGFVNKFLSWPLFKPLSRLTFCAYLVHPMILFAYYFSRRTTFYYTEFVMVWHFGSFLLFAYLASVGVALIFESPFLTLNRRFVKRVE